MFSQHPHLNRGRVADNLCRLVKPFVGLFPVQDPSLEKIVQNGIVQRLLIQCQQVVMTPDHVSPKAIIHVEIKEMVSMTMFLNHQRILSGLLSLETSSGVPGQDTANTSQGNGQCTHQKPVRYITNTFRIFQANLIAVFPAQEMSSTSTVFPVM